MLSGGGPGAGDVAAVRSQHAVRAQRADGVFHHGTRLQQPHRRILLLRARGAAQQVLSAASSNPTPYWSRRPLNCIYKL